MKKLLNISNFILTFSLLILSIFSFNNVFSASVDDYINPVGNRVFNSPTGAENKNLETVVQNVAGTLANEVVSKVLSVSGIMVLVLFLYAGIQYILAAGKPDKIKNANKTMKYAVIGICVIFVSFIVINFLFSVIKELGK